MRNKLQTLNGSTWDDLITDDELFGGVEYNATVNTATDIQYGVIAAGEIKFTSSLAVPIGTELKWLCKMMNDNTFRSKGTFTVNSVEATANGRYLHRAYDGTDILDRDITRHFKSFLYQNSDVPFTLEDVIEDICDYIFPPSPQTVSISGENDNIDQITYTGLAVGLTNGWLPAGTTTFSIASLSSMPTMTARDILSQCAEMIGCFGRCSTIDGLLTLQNYGTPIQHVRADLRYANSGSEEADDAGLPQVVTVQTANDIGQYVAPSAQVGDTVNQYRTTNIFASPVEGADVAAQNLYNGGNIYPVYRASQCKVYTDLAYFLSNSKTQSYDIAPTSDPVLVGTEFYQDKDGVFYIGGELQELASVNFTTGKNYYAIAETSANFTTISAWEYKGTYLYTLTKQASGYVYQTVENVAQHYIENTPLHIGNMAYFDSPRPTKLYELTEYAVKFNEPISFLTMTIGTAYRVKNDGSFVLGGTVTHNAVVSAQTNKTYYAIGHIENGEVVLTDEDIDTGRILVKVVQSALYDEGYLSDQTSYTPKYMTTGYKKRLGIIMSERIDKSGVTFSSTGGAIRQDTAQISNET